MMLFQELSINQCNRMRLGLPSLFLNNDLIKNSYLYGAVIIKTSEINSEQRNLVELIINSYIASNL